MAVVSNLVLDQGTTFSVVIGYNDNVGDPIDLTGYTARSQMRKSYYSSNATSFTSNISSAIDGEITLSLTAAETANVKAGRYLYDVEIVSGNTVIRVVEGIVTVMPEITK